MKRIDLKSGFLRSLTILTGGSLLAQLMVVGEQLCLTRLFTAEALGMYSFLLAFPQACIGMICGRYDLALVYEEDEEQVFPLVMLNFLINLTLSTVLSLGYGVYLWIFRPEYREFVYLTPAFFVYLLSYGLTNTLNAYNNRNRQYSMITRMHMLRTAVQCFGTVALGLLLWALGRHTDLRLSVPVLVLPYCVGMFFGVLTQGKGLFSHLSALRAVTFPQLWAAAKKHKKQPLVSAPAIFANGFSYSLVTMSISSLFGEATTGYYSMSSKLLGMPISLISGNISKVYMEEAAREYNSTGCFRRAFRKTFAFLALIAVPMFLCLYFLAPPVCAWLFGSEDWRIAGEYIRLLAPMFAVRFIATAVSPGLYVCRRQGTEFAVQCSLMVLTGLTGVLGAVLKLSTQEFLLSICAVRSCVMAGQILAVYYYSRGGSPRIPDTEEKKHG